MVGAATYCHTMANSNTIGSGSYIKIVCTYDADPKYNRLQLRTDPPTFIELQPGNNILSVSKYPALKYGFKQIDIPWFDKNVCPDATNQYNCGDVLLVDLSHFDSAEMTSMEDMFRKMENLKEIIFGDIRIENVISMNSAFEWTAVENLDLTHIDFSQVIDAEMMTYSQGNLRVNLSGCDLSKVIAAEGIFNGVTQLNLDRATLSEAIIEAMRWDAEGSCEDLEEISMIDCDIRFISSVIKKLNFLRTRVKLNHKAEGIILDYISHSLPIPWTQIDPYQWYFTIVSGDLSVDNEIQRVIIEYLKRKGLIGNIRFIEHHHAITQGKSYYSWENVYQCGEEFPIALIKAFFNFRLGIASACCSRETYSFVVGNDYAAFSNNPNLKFYVPSLYRGFESIDDVLEYLINITPIKQSQIRILEIQYLNPTDNPTVLNSSIVWTQANILKDSNTLPFQIEVTTVDLLTVFNSIEKEAEGIIEAMKKEMDEKVKSPEADEETEFDPDFVPEEV